MFSRYGTPRGCEQRTEMGNLGERMEDVSSLSFSPDGSRLASESADCRVRLWDGTSGVPIATLEGNSPLFSPTGPDLLRYRTTTQNDCGMVRQGYQLPPSQTLGLYHSRPTGLDLLRDPTTIQ